MKIRPQHLARPLVAVAAAMLLAPSALAAQPQRLDPWGSDARQGRSVTGPVQARSPAAERPTAVTIVEPGAFDWGDAGVGAAGAFGLTLLASGLLIVSRHRPRSAA